MGIRQAVFNDFLTIKNGAWNHDAGLKYVGEGRWAVFHWIFRWWSEKLAAL
jgi:hypothetical protein